jgi:hypothetical protein
VKWFHFDVWKCRYHSALDFISASRPLIEWTVAERVRRLPNVKMLHGWSVESIVYDGHSVSGVRMHRRDDRETEQRTQCGSRDRRERRGSQISQQLRVWVSSAGGVGGADRRRLRQLSCSAHQAPRATGRRCMSLSQPPAKRGALILPLEGDRWICTLIGMHGDHPPADLAGYMAFAKSLPCRTCTKRCAARSRSASRCATAFLLDCAATTKAAALSARPAGARRCAVQLQSRSTARA